MRTRFATYTLAVILEAAILGQSGPDTTPHSVQFLTVDKDIKLEVLDWGGTGRPLVLLAGGGDTAHRLDRFATKLINQYHVYGITRRGFGASSAPAITPENFASDRLGDDVLAVLDQLKLNKPVLAGHSMAGAELSSIGSRYPERIIGLIYLDAGYSYAFDNDSAPPLSFPPDLPPIIVAAMAGAKKYSKIPVPVLAIFALPHASPATVGDDASARAAFDREEAVMAAQAKAFEAGVPTARVVRIPNANHYVYISNQADVLREMNMFISQLP
jgi:pimeloyl-ACP methyl ester carboxylesterase